MTRFRVHGAGRFGGAGVLTILLLLLLLSIALVAEAQERPIVRVNTDAGAFVAVLQPELAPHHVAQFLHFARTGFYAGTYFHRLVPGFVIQGGDPNSKDRDPRNDGRGGPQLSDILTEEDARLFEQLNAMLAEKGYVGIQAQANLKAEFTPDAQHVRGTLSMARGPDPDSAGSQFFVCVDRNPQTASLDGQYTIFGQVFAGMDVVDTIVSAELDPARGRQQPREPVHILGIDLIESPAALSEDERQAYETWQAEMDLGR